MTAGTANPVKRRTFLRASGVAGLTGLAGCLTNKDGRVAGPSGVPASGVMYMDPSCTCCDRYMAYLAKRGRQVDVRPVEDVAAVKAEYGIPRDPCPVIRW